MSSEKGWCGGGGQNWGVFCHRTCRLTLIPTRGTWGVSLVCATHPQGQSPSGLPTWTRRLHIQCSCHTSPRPLTILTST